MATATATPTEEPLTVGVAVAVAGWSVSRDHEDERWTRKRRMNTRKAAGAFGANDGHNAGARATPGIVRYGVEPEAKGGKDTMSSRPKTTLAGSIARDIEAALAQSRARAGAAMTSRSGAHGHARVISLMQQQTDAFGIELKDIGLDGILPEQDLV